MGSEGFAHAYAVVVTRFCHCWATSQTRTNIWKTNTQAPLHKYLVLTQNKRIASKRQVPSSRTKCKVNYHKRSIFRQTLERLWLFHLKALQQFCPALHSPIINHKQES